MLRPSSKWHLQPESYPRHFLKWTTLLLAVEKWQLHFKISLNISREKILVIKRPSKVNGCYLAPVYLNLIWWQTGSWTRLKIRCWLSAELLTHQCFTMYLNAFLYPALHNIQPQLWNETALVYLKSTNMFLTICKKSGRGFFSKRFWAFRFFLSYEKHLPSLFSSSCSPQISLHFLHRHYLEK